MSAPFTASLTGLRFASNALSSAPSYSSSPRSKTASKPGLNAARSHEAAVVTIGAFAPG